MPNANTHGFAKSPVFTFPSAVLFSPAAVVSSVFFSVVSAFCTSFFFSVLCTSSFFSAAVVSSAFTTSFFFSVSLSVEGFSVDGFSSDGFSGSGFSGTSGVSSASIFPSFIVISETISFAKPFAATVMV